MKVSWFGICFISVQSLLGLTGAVKFATEFAAYQVLFMGEGYTERLLHEDDQKEFEKLNAEQSKIRESFVKFQTKMQDDTQKRISFLGKKLQQGIQKLEQQRGQAEKILVERLNHIKKTINLDIPKQRYLVYPILYEQQFKAGRMLPEQPWYNIFQGLAGDWAYQAPFGFMQRVLVPWTTTQQALQNIIFTDYIAPEKSYEIEVELSLIKASYPFFAGLAFNKARWLSGDTERMYQYRLVGFYGQTSNKEPSVSLCFAQGVELKKEGTTIKFFSPLEKIVTQPEVRLYQLPKELVQHLNKDTQTYILNIKTSALTVDISLSRKKDQQREQLFTTTLAQLDLQQSRVLFWYHGIGFISPGCVAAFDIKRPTVLSAVVKRACG